MTVHFSTRPRGTRSRFVAACLATLLLTGCEVWMHPPAPGPEQHVTPTPSPEETARRKEIEFLLDEAYRALQQDKLTTPLNDNAYYRYLRVLSLDPDNAEAEQGISDIVEKYLEWAIEYATDGRFGMARRNLNKARSVDETHPNIPAVARLIEDQENAKRMTYQLSPDRLRQRTSSMVEEIVEIGREASSHGATVVIYARSDEEGRWIYRQLNRAAPERIRARIELSTPPRIRLVY